MNGLSCFTANIHAYMAAEWDADAVLARSIRLTARIGLDGWPDAFSHHDPALDLLPDGTQLAFRSNSSWQEAADQVKAEVIRHGRALILVDGARLPWSTVVGRPASAVPHLALVDAVEPGRWHVSDEFTALLPGGWQEPGRGWLTPDLLHPAFTAEPDLLSAPAVRAAMAFGSRRKLPPPGAVWLSRTERPVAPVSEPPDGDWLQGHAAVCHHLAHGVRRAELPRELADDLWTAAGHRVFDLTWRAREMLAPPHAEALVNAWSALPRTIHFALESAARGRRRDDLIISAFTRLAELESEVP